MPDYRPLGNQLVTNEEYVERILNKDHEVMAELEATPLSPIGGGTKTEFKPIGLNRPLLIEIVRVYTGMYPRSNIPLVNLNDMLVATAIRPDETFEGSPRAINFLKQNVKPNSIFDGPGASQSGTTLVYYTPAVVEPNNYLDVELIFDKFNSDFVNEISSAFMASAAIPFFAAYSTHLLAVGVIAKLLGKVSESIFDGKPSFIKETKFSIHKAGENQPAEKFHVLFEDDIEDQIEDHGIEWDEEHGLVLNKSDKKLYKGPHPYVVLRFDGAEVPAYKDFKPSALTARMMERFYSKEQEKFQSSQVALEAFSLYNDLLVRREIDALDAKIAEPGLDQSKKDEYEEIRQAFEKNFVTEYFK